MTAPLWTPGTLKQPGDIVRPTSAGAVSAPGLDNPHFDDGASGWTFTGAGSFTIDTQLPVFDGTYSGKLGWTSNPNDQIGIVTNDARIPVTPGQVVTMSVYLYAQGSNNPGRFAPYIQWFNANGDELAPSTLPLGPQVDLPYHGYYPAYANGVWVQLTVQGTAPAGAATATARFLTQWGDYLLTIDFVTFELANQAAPNNNLYRAVQAAAGFTANVEPDWPTTIGLTVVDNEVTWECVSGNSITWQAHRILVSASPTSNEDVEPDWPLMVNGTVPDNTITWTLNPRRITDEHNPQSEIVLIAASKVYAADDDIIDYSATANPLDWSTVDDAGYIGYGLQVYGANPVSAMGLYRGNIAAFNSQGCQIWQVDEDPAAITLLDAVPIPCTYPKSLAPVGDDLVFLSNLGVRSLGVAGSQINLQSGGFGRAIDPLVVAAIAAAVASGVTPRGLYWPAQGQYWIIFGDQAFVHTVTGPAKENRSWARYTFPWEITDWTILGDDLCLRAGDVVVKVTADAHLDDQRGTSGYLYGDGTHGIEGEAIVSVIQWPALDLGNFNSDKALVAFDLAITGECQVSFGWDQRALDYDPSGPWTAPYTVSGDTVPGTPVPMDATAPSFSMRLEFANTPTPWKWYSANLYLKDLSKQ